MNANLKQVTDIFMPTIDPRLQRGFSEIIQHLVTTKSCIMSEWARSAYNFEAFIKKCYRFFKNEQIDWKVNNIVLQFILPRFKHKKYIPVPIDPSFVPNNMLGSYAKTRSDQVKAKKGFFIFSAALPVRGRAISFFQGFWHNAEINNMTHKSFNQLAGVFILQIKTLLRDVLSKAVLILDRGFGYEYFLKKLVEYEVNYVVRIRDIGTHVTLVRGKKKLPISKLIERVKNEPIIFKVLYKNVLPINVAITKKKGSAWVLASNLDDPSEIIELYTRRMKIEETFKDWKSTGFDIEKLQILKWSVLPKIIWCVVIAHMLLYLLGEAIDRSRQHRKLFKKFIQDRKNLSCVQLAWKAWRFALDDILPLFLALKSLLSTPAEACL